MTEIEEGVGPRSTWQLQLQRPVVENQLPESVRVFRTLCNPCNPGMGNRDPEKFFDRHVKQVCKNHPDCTAMADQENSFPVMFRKRVLPGGQDSSLECDKRFAASRRILNRVAEEIFQGAWMVLTDFVCCPAFPGPIVQFAKLRFDF